MLEGTATAAAASRVPATEQSAAELQRLAAGEVAVAGAVSVGRIQPVQYTLKDPHLRFACCECESAVQHHTCKH
jgi:long-subunit fatty acid transport protein